MTLPLGYTSFEDLKGLFGRQSETDWCAHTIMNVLKYKLPVILQDVFRDFDTEKRFRTGMSFLANNKVSADYAIISNVLKTYAVELVLESLPEEQQQRCIKELIQNSDYIAFLKCLPLHKRVPKLLDDILAMTPSQDVVPTSSILRIQDDDPSDFDTTLNGKIDFLRWLIESARRNAPTEITQKKVQAYRKQFRGWMVNSDPMLCRVLDDFIESYDKRWKNSISERRQELLSSIQYNAIRNNATRKHSSYWFEMYQHSCDLRYFNCGEEKILANTHEHDLVVDWEYFRQSYINFIQDTLIKYPEATILYEEEVLTQERIIEELEKEDKSPLGKNRKRTIARQIIDLHSTTSATDYLDYQLLNALEKVEHNVDSALKTLGCGSYITEAMFIDFWRRLEDEFLQNMAGNEHPEVEPIFQQKYIAYRYIIKNYDFPKTASNSTERNDAITQALALFNFESEWDSLTKNDISKKYRALALRYHPDRPGGDAQVFQQITKAYELLTYAKENNLNYSSVNAPLNDSSANAPQGESKPVEHPILTGINTFNEYVLKHYKKQQNILNQNKAFCKAARAKYHEIVDKKPSSSPEELNEVICNEIFEIARNTFKHRDFYKRLLADVLFIPLGIVSLGTLFYAKYQITGSMTFLAHKTARQTALEEKYLNNENSASSKK